MFVVVKFVVQLNFRMTDTQESENLLEFKKRMSRKPLKNASIVKLKFGIKNLVN